MTGRYEEPKKAEMVTFWLKDGRTIMSVVANGCVQDFEVPIRVLEATGRCALETLLKAAQG